MPSVHLVGEDEGAPTIVTSVPISPDRVWSYIGASALLLEIIGTWLVWFSAVVQQSLHEDGIRAAFQRAMPDQVDRCFDTVVIQRGGGRR